MEHQISISENLMHVKLRHQNTDWEEVLHLATRCEMAKGTIIPAVQNTNFFYIQKGCVRLERLSSSGEEHIALFFEEGCLFAEMTSILYGSGSPEDSHTYFYVQEDSVFYKFDAELLSKGTIIKEYPHLTMSLLRSVAHKATLLLRNGTTNLMHTPEQRVCRALLTMFHASHDEHTFNPKISQVELGTILGMPRSTLCRTLGQLRNKGILGVFTSSKIEILDVEKLKELASM